MAGMGGAAAGGQSTAGFSEEAFALVATQMGFACPITQDIFQDPVVAADGYSYERRSITEWLARNDTSPITNDELTHKRLTPNRNLKSSIETWLELQHGEARAEKRRKTSAEAIKKFLEALAELVRTDNIADVVKGLKLGDDLELHTRVLDALCRYSYGGTENRARIDVGGGLEASVATMKVHMLPSRNGWRLACLDACSILEMAVVNSGVDGHAILAAIHRAGGIRAVADLVNARYTDPEVLMRALNLLCEFLNIVSLPFALDVAEMVVGFVVQPIVNAMDLHLGNFGVLSCACRTLGELARDVEGRATAENIAEICAGGGVMAVVRAVKRHMSGGDKTSRHKFILVSCNALHSFVLDDAVCQSSEADDVLRCLCGVIRKYPTHDGVMDAAVPALLTAVNVRECAEKKALAYQVLGRLCGMMLVLNNNLARKKSAAVVETLGHTMRLLATLYVGDVMPHDGCVQQIVGVMKMYVKVLQIQVSAVVFLKQCASIPGMDAVIIEAGGFEALLESVHNHVDCRLGGDGWHVMGLLLSAETREARKERADRVIAAGGMKVLRALFDNSDCRRGLARVAPNLPLFAKNALLVLPKLCEFNANYKEFLALDGAEELAEMVTRFTHEEHAVACMIALHGIYCRSSAAYAGLSFSAIEVVVEAMKRHRGNGALQAAACGIVGMFFRCLRHGVEKDDAGDAGEAGGSGVEWCMCAVLSSMQFEYADAEDVLVMEVGFKSLLRFLALRESVDMIREGTAEVCAGGGGELALGALRMYPISGESTGMRGGAFKLLAKLCVGSEKQTAVALDGGVQHALDSLRSGACGETEAYEALNLLEQIASWNDKTTAEIVVRGGIRAALAMLAKGAAVGTDARLLSKKACAVLLALVSKCPACESFALMGGIGVVVQAMKAYREDRRLENLVLLLHRVSLNEGLRTSIVTAGGVEAVLEFVGPEVERESEYSKGSTLHYYTSKLLCNLAKQSSLLEVLKQDALGWVEAVLERGVAISESCRMEYESVVKTLRDVPEVGVVCPYCGESASGLAAFERHMEWHSMSRFVVTVSFWTYGSHLESSVKIDGLGSPLLEQVLAKFKCSEKWCGKLPKEGVRVFLGDDSRFVLTELDARASLTGIRAQGGVHVVGGTVQALAGSMRLHIFDCSDGCRAKEGAGSVFMQRQAGGFW